MSTPESAEPTPTADTDPDLLSAEERYFNREMSWLAFNERVLAEAQQRSSYPLLERLRFLSISGSNLDEFMMIRVAGLVGQVRSGVVETSLDRRAHAHAAARRDPRRSCASWKQRQQDTLARTAAAAGRAGHPHQGRGPPRCRSGKRWLRQYFLDHIMPVITPQAIDPAHPFPFVANMGMGVLFNLTRKADDAAS